MADCQDVNLILGHVERIGSLSRSGWRLFYHLHVHACAHRRWQLQEDRVEACVVNLSCSAQEPSGSRTLAVLPLAMSRSACWIEFSKSGVNSRLSSMTSSSHS